MGFSKTMILEGEIKDAKMSSFSSDFETVIQHQFPLYFLYELLMSLRKCYQIKINLSEFMQAN